MPRSATMRFPEGRRVRFRPTPASMMLYNYRTPQDDEEGTVVSVPVPGRGRVTSIGGPGGGLVYVKWDRSGHIGVSKHDVEPAARRNPHHFTATEARRQGMAIGERFRRFTPAELARGMDIELEHGRVHRSTDVTHDAPRATAKIALAHLRERPDYYKRLERYVETNPLALVPYDPARARRLRRAEQATSPTQSLAARRARHYGGVGYYATIRDLKRRYPTGTIVRVTYGKTTGSGAHDVREWRIGPRGLQATGRGVAWTPYTKLMKRRLGASLAILGAEPVGRNPAKARGRAGQEVLSAEQEHALQKFFHSRRGRSKEVYDLREAIPSHYHPQIYSPPYVRPVLPGVRRNPVPLTTEEYEALQRFARKHGRTWRSKLMHDWASARPLNINERDAGALRRVRNKIGPSGLKRLPVQNPFAGFRDFAACERYARSRGARNAGAYCGAIKHRTEGRNNPSIYSQDLRPGDVIMLDGIGREHVIEGPFRSGNGIKFRDQHGNTIKLQPNEIVNRVGHANPTRKSMARKSARHVYANPIHRIGKDGWIDFKNGHRYHVGDAATQREAARYLAHDVKMAEHRGQRVPRGPHGLTPTTAAILLHYGRLYRAAGRRAVHCPPCPVPRPHRRPTRAAAPRQRPAPRPRRAAAPAAPPPKAPVDQIDWTHAVWGL